MKHRPLNENVDRLPDETIISVIGYETERLSQLTNNIRGSESHIEAFLADYKTGDAPLYEAHTANYTLQLLKVISGLEAKKPKCGLWSGLDITPNDEDIIAYSKNKDNSKTSTYKMVFKKYLKNAKTTKKLKKKLKSLKPKTVGSALKVVQQEIRKIREREWNYSAKIECADELESYKALIAFEDHLVAKSKECVELVEEQLPMDMTRAVKVLKSALSDPDSLLSLLSTKPTDTVLNEYTEITSKITSSTLGVLSTTLARDLLIGNVEVLKVTACETCECERRQKELTSAIRKLRKLTDNKINSFCFNEWDEVKAEMENLDGTQQLAYLLANKVKLIEALHRTRPSADQLFGLDTPLPYFIWNVYTNQRFSELPIRMGVWWYALNFVSFENCNHFREVHFIRELLENYAQVFFYGRYSVLSTCGRVEEADPIDSMLLSDIQASWKMSQMYREYDVYKMGELGKMAIANGHDITPNKIEEVQFFVAGSLLSEALFGADDVQKRLNNVIFAATKYSNLQSNMSRDYDSIMNIMSFLESCFTCELLNIQLLSTEYGIMKQYNFYEERLGPYKYEEPKYLAIRESFFGDLSHCAPTLDEMMSDYKERFEEVLKSKLMEQPQVYEAFFEYLTSPTNILPPKELLLKQLAVDTDNREIENAFSMRVFKSGLEDKDDRSLYDDYLEFEEAYVGKKTTKVFKNVYKSFIEARSCMAEGFGVFKYDESKLRNPISPTCEATTEKSAKSDEGTKERKASKNKKRKKKNKKNDE